MAVSAATVIRLRSRLDSPGRSQTSPNRTFSLRSMSFGATGRTTSRAVVGAGCVLTVCSFLCSLRSRLTSQGLYALRAFDASHVHLPTEKLAAVEDFVAQLLEPQRGIVGATVDRLGEPDLDDPADEHRVIALLDRCLERALDERRQVGQDRRAGGAGTERLTGDRVALLLRRLEEREGEPLLALAQHVQREGLRVLDEAMGAGVRLHADGDQRRLERRLRHPVDGGGRHAAVGVRRSQDVEAIADHPERGLLGVGVHGFPPGPEHTADDGFGPDFADPKYFQVPSREDGALAEEDAMPLTELNHYFIRANNLEQT